MSLASTKVPASGPFSRWKPLRPSSCQTTSCCMPPPPQGGKLWAGRPMRRHAQHAVRSFQPSLRQPSLRQPSLGPDRTPGDRPKSCHLNSSRGNNQTSAVSAPDSALTLTAPRAPALGIQRLLHALHAVACNSLTAQARA